MTTRMTTKATSDPGVVVDGKVVDDSTHFNVYIIELERLQIHVL